MLEAILGWAIFLALAAVIERQLEPQPPGLRRPAIAWATFFLAGTLWYALLLALTGRVLLSLVLALAGATALCSVSNAKYRLLREPLVFADFALLPQVFRHPRLYYVELFQQVRTWLFIAPVLGLLAFWFWFEPSSITLGQRLFLALGLPLIALALPFLPGLGPLVRQAAARVLPAPDPAGSVGRLGISGSILLSYLRWMDTHPLPAEPPLPMPNVRRREGDAAPLVIAVQSESFLDLRRLRNDAPELPNLAAAQARAVAWGPLQVPAIGAYTMRTEYAFLTATPNDQLGFDALNPYLRADAHPLPALPALLSEAGWETLFVHPHVADFFRRDRVMPALGFKRMITEEAFNGVERLGPYVSDAALTSAILEELTQIRRACFLFTVTMENHGPWRAGRLPGLTQETEIYGKHLVHADAMLGRLLTGLEDSGRPWALCFFGDHPPILRSIGNPAPDDRSDYLIVTSSGTPSGAAEQIDAAELGRRLRQEVRRLS
ncbi:MAG TPA: LTA synthase family protein [Kiloniellales bacterium]|nr:LTA synthase family protein [Kiloniellales bacterium]